MQHRKHIPIEPTTSPNELTQQLTPSSEHARTHNMINTKENYSSKTIMIISISLWYVFSVSISLYNKWMFNPNLNFSYPILITSCHQLILFLLSASVLMFSKKFRLNDKKLSYWMHYKKYLSQIIPCSLSSAADIGLGNYSFKFITLSLYTMVKSSAIVFVLIWGVIFKLEKLSFKLCIIVAIMTIGVMMMVYGQQDNQDPEMADPNKLFIGCFLVLSSACMSGLRWALTQVLLKKNTYTKNPILTIFYISPSMCLTLVLIGGLIEGWGNFINASIWQEKGFFTTIILLIIPGLLAFLMTLSEFTLLQHAPLLTLSIAGIFKEILTIMISSIVFGDRLNFINLLGLVVTLGDILWYNYYRYQEEQQYEELIEEQDEVELRNV